MNYSSRRSIKAISIIAAMLILLAACGNSSEKYDGISGETGKYKYRVKLEGRSITGIFTLVGDPGYIHTDSYDNGVEYGITSSGGAYFCEVAEGGWVAYNSNEFIYMPYETNENLASLSCGSLAAQTTDVMNYSDFCNLFDFVN